MKKIAVNTVKSYMKEHPREDAYTQTFEVGESSFDVVFHTALTTNEKSIFISRVVSGCFDATGKFRPEYVSPMLRATIIQMCTNIPALTLKNETDQAGAAVLDIDGMNELYLAMDLDNVQDRGYQSMMHEMVPLCGQAIDWQKSHALAEHSTDAALRHLLDALTAKVDSLDMDSLLQYAGTLSKATEGLGEGDILKGLMRVKSGETEAPAAD